jgi:hypothetical protein
MIIYFFMTFYVIFIFLYIVVTQGMSESVSCNICHKDALTDSSIDYTVPFVKSATNTMMRHMQKYHKEEMKVVKEKNADEAVEAGKCMGEYITYGGGFFQAFIYWAIKSYQPMNTVEDPNFRAMCYELNPKVKHLDRHTVANKIGDIALWAKSVLKLLVVGVYYALTSDHWTSIAGISYLGVTIHFIDEEFKLVSFTLSCAVHSGDSMAPDILRELQEVWESYGLDPKYCVGCVTDTAPVMGSFGRLLSSTFGIPHMYCVDHSMELITV